MENQNQDKEVYDFIERIVKKPISPSETLSNPMRVKTSQNSKLIQPHNFRRYFNFERANYNPTLPYFSKNHDSEHHFYNFYGCTIILRKKLIEIINLWHNKQWRLISTESQEGIQEQIENIKIEMEMQTITALEQFIKVNGGKSDYKPIEKRKSEIGIHGDSYIDKIPKELIIHDTYFKKVYDDKTEFIGENEVKNYISNRALENFSPEITKELNKQNELITAINNKLIPAINNLALNMNTHISVLKGIKKAFNRFNRLTGNLPKVRYNKKVKDFWRY